MTGLSPPHTDPGERSSEKDGDFSTAAAWQPGGPVALVEVVAAFDEPDSHAVIPKWRSTNIYISGIHIYICVCVYNITP